MHSYTEGIKLCISSAFHMFEVERYNDDVTLVKTSTAMEDGHPIMWAIAYLIEDTLFDAGCANALEDIEKFAANTEVNKIYISHAHEDHTGGCSAFVPGTKIFAMEQDIEIIKNPPTIPEFFDFVWGQPKPIADVEKMPLHFTIRDLEFDVVSLPGHGQQMVGFYEPNRKWLFSADSVPVPSRKIIGMPDENIHVMIETLEKIVDMDIEILFDSHRGPITTPKEHVQVRVDFLNDIRLQVKKLHNEGKSIPEIQEALELSGPWYLEMTAGRFGIDIFLNSIIFDKANGD
ncbi:MAG: MBL fold metallo-hydrolase [Candidatus Thorarchaeota archaeon]